MLDELAQKAIDEALRGQWEEAKRLNEELLKADPKNQEALNRLARALLELGRPDRAIASYKKVLRLDPYNSIAQKALGRLTKASFSPGRQGKTPKRKDGASGPQTPRVTELFLEEPGKTKTVALIHLGDETVISSLDTGEPVKLHTHTHRVSVQTESGQYIGRFPDDLARRIVKLTRAGNEYFSFVRSVTPDSVKIFIREIKRGEDAPDIPSFPPTEKLGYISFTSPELVHEERPEMPSEEDGQE
ncbi:MAG: tetratricopeptide repeat protein [bacterium]|nr:tetratricopeptide repeat protein [bacterium]